MDSIEKSDDLSVTSWMEFKELLQSQFYPLGHHQQMKRFHFKQAKGRSVQDYTIEIKKRVALVGASLKSQEALLKYIGCLHSYLRHTILLFNPTDFDKVCVQAQHLEVCRKSKMEEKNSKTKPHGRDKIKALSKRDDKKLHCSHCDKDGQIEEKCWKLHLKLKPRIFKKGSKKKK